MQTLVLLDDSVIDQIAPLDTAKIKVVFAISARQNSDNPEFLTKYPHLQVLPNTGRIGHSRFNAGEVFASNEEAVLTNELLAIAANQKQINKVAQQTGYNQRNDIDIVSAAINNKCIFLVSNDKKSILLDKIVKQAAECGVTILSSNDFVKIFKRMLV